MERCRHNKIEIARTWTGGGVGLRGLVVVLLRGVVVVVLLRGLGNQG